jgi:transketolase
MDAVEQAQSGHPGTPMALAPAAYVLWTRHLRHAPSHPDWANRDRFVLSCGHASMLLYSVLYLSGYGLTLDDLKHFRQWGSKTPGHPERGHTPGVETTTGPLGQGVGNAVGMAIAERLLAARFNRPGHTVVDHRTWAFASDGDMMEGVASEAASLAGHLRLGKLRLVYDSNHITIDGSTDRSFSEDVGRRFEAYGWSVLHLDDGNDLDAIDRAMAAANAETERPTLIVLHTVIADPAPTKRNTSEAHGAPLGKEEIKLTKELLGWPAEPFFVPEEALQDMGRCRARGEAWVKEWNDRFAALRASEPELAAAYDRALAGDLRVDWESVLPKFAPTEGQATRAASGTTLAALSAVLPELVGGSADLATSTGTNLKKLTLFSADHVGQTFAWGIREHGMGAILNGMAAHGGVHPYGSTFLVFSDYMKPPMRLAALMQLPVTYIFTHDSIGVGEDGPTHQPIEHLALLRSIPNMTVIRPADAPETAQAWRAALEHRDGPVALILSRQKLPTFDRTVYGSAEGTRRGGYVLYDPPGGPQAIVLASGSEVHIGLAAAQQLAGEGVRVRVVSLPSWELFRRQPAAYRDEVLPPAIRARVSIEAATAFGWERWVTEDGESIAIDHFGASAPGERLFTEFGFTPAHVVAAIRRVLSRKG